MADNFQTFLSGSLYVGDLDPNVTEAQLFDKFGECGTISLVKVCRDKVTRQSLGYAYVNFSQPADAERALDTFNFDLLNGRPMRIMWSQRDPALRRSGVGNVFIKNLDKSIDNKSLYDTFSTFGNIISCKIMADETGSKGYGFVHFETQEAAEKAIKSVNNMSLNGKIVYVGQFFPKHSRAANENEASRIYTNVYVKNFQDKLDETKLIEIFSKFGEITSVKVPLDDEGKPKGFGFVNFKNPDDASKAVQQMNDFSVSDRRLYVGRFQKKFERINELRRKYEERKLEKQKKYQGVNLFLKNLDDKIDDERLRKEFSKFGNITSAKVMHENGRSKGFGFVCYSTPEEATKASAEMNGRILSTKPLYVALAQRKDERSKILAARFKERLMSNQYYSQSNFAPQNPSVYFSYQNPSTNLANQPNPRFNSPPTIEDYQQFMGNPNMRPTTTSVPRWQMPSNYQRLNQATNQSLNDNIYAQYMPTPQQQINPNVGMQQHPTRAIRPNFNTNVFQKPVNPGSFALNNYQNRFNNPQHYNQVPSTIRNTSPRYKQNTQQPLPQVVNVPGQEPLTLQELSAADPKQQKQMLGERLFPLIQNFNFNLAGKITGMLLEIDNAELLHMIDSPESLKAKVEEALTVLQSHQEKQLQQQH